MTSEEIRQSKKELRRTIRRQLKELAPEQLRRESQAVSAAFCRLPEWSASRDVLLFLSMSGEIDTTGLLQAAIDSGKRVWSPRMHGREMEFHLIWNGEHTGAEGATDTKATDGAHSSVPPDRAPPLSFLDLRYNPYGIWEPQNSAPKFGDIVELGPEDRCIMATPGLAFDRSGGRLGRGKAYYDKWQSRHNELIESGRLVPVGIGFTPQLVEEVPCDENDKNLPQLIIGGVHIRCSQPG